MRNLILCLLAALTSIAAGAEPLFEAGFIFDPEAEDHGHVHASCIVVCPNGDLRAVWYENGTPLPPPYFSEQRDKSGDVRIGGARRPAGKEAWERPFVMADSFGVSDNNPCMVVDAEQRLWLVHATLLGVPENSWGSALVRYRVASKYDMPGAPAWDKEEILAMHPIGLEDALLASFNRRPRSEAQQERALDRVRKSTADPLQRRLGWMPRAHPLVRSDGALIIPLANENYNAAAMAITQDGGETWTISKTVPGRGVIQPSVVELAPNHLAAFFRDAAATQRIMRSDSTDGGLSWSFIEATDLPNSGAGIEAIRLANGSLLMIYNDEEESPRDRLAVSISEDGGATWPWTRHVEDIPGGRFDYPSVVQAPDGSLHATYSYNLETIKHVHFNEAWVRQGGGTP